jgi:hypothetical protein
MAFKRKATWLDVAVSNGGFRNAVKALSWAHSWVHVQVALDRDPSVDEVAEWWNTPRRSAFREQSAFRMCFPMLESPAAIYSTDEAMQKVRRTVEVLAKYDAWRRSDQAPEDTELLDVGLHASES